MAFNQQHSNLTRISSAPTALQDINLAPNYVPQFPFTGPPRALNVDMQPAQNPPIHPSGPIPNMVFPNFQWDMPTQRMIQPLQTGTVPGNTGIPPPSTQLPELGEHQLKRKLSTMLQSEQLELFESNTGECQVTCGDRSWKVHGYIVARKCNFFAVAMEWKRDEEDKVIDMSGDDPQAVDIFLRYLYTRSTKWVGVSIPAFDQRAQLLAKVAIVADKYHQVDLLSQVRFELSKWAQCVMTLNLGKGAKDALLALIKLREHDAVSEPLRQLQRVLCRFLRDSGQLQRMDTAMTTLLENAVQTDPTLAATLIQYCSGGPSAVPSS